MTYISVELRQRVSALSGGCCEYCRVPQNAGTANYHFEHIIALSHGGQTTESNLAYSCSRCNLYKGTNIAAADPQTNQATFLFHPRNQVWRDNFEFDGALIVPLTPEGRTTEFVLHLNDPDRVEYRRDLIELGVYPCEEDRG